jgi:hypothetical protein
MIEKPPHDDNPPKRGKVIDQQRPIIHPGRRLDYPAFLMVFLELTDG